MRKVLSFVLVLAMILGSVSMAFAFSDTADKTYEEAALVLNELGVISGYADGTFGGDKNITRAEFATMIVNALGFTTTGAAETGFKDVPNDYWAAQAILTAKNLGITSGYSDGTFQPKKNITCDEAIAMFVRALGYKAEYLMGTYPTSYVNQAMTLAILDDVNVGSVAATRGDVAQLIFNGLGVAFVSYDRSTGDLKEGATLISRLGASASKGLITDKTTGVIDVKALLGQFGDIYTNKDGKVIAFAPACTLLTGTYDETEKTLTLADDTKYDVVDADDTEYVNGKKANGADATFPVGKYVNGVAKAVNFEKTVTVAAKVDGLQIKDIYSFSQWLGTDYQADAEVIADDLALKTPMFFGTKLALTTSNKIDTAAYTVAGAASLEAIPDDAIVTVYVADPATGDDYVAKVEVSTKTVEGTIEKITSSGKYFVGSEGFKAALIDGSDEMKIGSVGTAYLNYAGKVAIWDETETQTAYAIVLAAENTKEGYDVTGSTAYVKLFLADGKEATYEVPKTAKINGATEAIGTTGLLSFATTLNAKDQLVKFTLNADGKIATIAKVTTNGTASAVKVSAANTINGDTINDKTVVFTYSVDGTTYSWAVGTTELANTEITGNYYQEKRVVKVAVIEKADVASKYVVINDAAKINNKTYDYELYVLEAGKEVTYNLAKTANTVTGAAVYAITLDANGAVSKAIAPAAERTTTQAVTVANAAYVSTDGTVVTVEKDGTGSDAVFQNYLTLAKDVVVYKWNASDEVYEVVTVKALKSLDAATVVEFVDTTSTKDGVYDIVVINPQALDIAAFN